MVRALAAAGLAVALLGCGNTATPLPAGMNLLEANTAPLPAATATDKFPESLSIVVGSKDAYDWGHGRAYLKVSPAAVWQALQDPEVVVDRHGTDAHEIGVNVEPKYPFSFRIHYTKSIVEWWENWRFGELDFDAEQPQLALIRYQKTDGTSFITLIEGSILVAAVEGQPGVSLVELINHVKATGADTDTVKTTLNNQYGSLLAKVQGKPLP